MIWLQNTNWFERGSFSEYHAKFLKNLEHSDDNFMLAFHQTLRATRLGWNLLLCHSFKWCQTKRLTKIVENQQPKIILIDNLTRLHLRSENWFFIFFANYNKKWKMLRKLQFLKTRNSQITILSGFCCVFYSFRKIQKNSDTFAQNTA